MLFNRRKHSIEESPENGNASQAREWQHISEVPFAGDANSNIEKRIFSRISSDKHKSRILAFMTEVGFERPGDISVSNINSFLEQYPTPESFEKPGNDFLSKLENSNNTPEKYREYVQALHEFKFDIYGPAEAQYEATKNRDARLLGEKYLPHAIVDGDPFVQDGKEYRLTVESLANNGLEPRHEVQLGDTTIGLSDAFNVGSRPCCIAYVKNGDGEVKVRSYYRSNSAGLWRYLPDYVQDESSGKMWYGKGYSEDSLTLPSELQSSLSEIAKAPKVDTKNTDPTFFLSGTAKRYSSKEEYNRCKRERTMRGDFYTEVDIVPSLDLDRIEPTKNPPSSLVLDEPLMPDFSKKQDSYTFPSGLNGLVQAEQFASRDGRLTYTFNSSAVHGDLETWIGQIDMNSEITSTGCRKRWVSAGDYCTPLYEYASQADRYGNTADSKGAYVNMWSGYLSKIPVIREYIQYFHTSK